MGQLFGIFFWNSKRMAFLATMMEAWHALLHANVHTGKLTLKLCFQATPGRVRRGYGLGYYFSPIYRFPIFDMMGLKIDMMHGSKNGSNTLNGCVWCCPHEATGSWVGRTQCHPIAQDEAVMASRTEFGNLSACAKDILNLQKLWLPQRWWSFEDRIFLLITTCIEPPVSDGSLKKWTAGQIWQSSLFSVKVS